MEKVILFYLSDCPYCHYAKRAVKELKEETAAYGGIGIEWVDESRKPDISAKYDYYYVPTIFYGKEKLYEAHPFEDYAACKKNVKAALDKILKER